MPRAFDDETSSDLMRTSHAHGCTDHSWGPPVRPQVTVTTGVSVSGQLPEQTQPPRGPVSPRRRGGAGGKGIWALLRAEAG